MHDFELEQLRRHPSWRATLRSYWELQQEGRNRASNFDGWVPRVADVPKVDPAELSGVHGRLIAFGFLKFDLAGRELGMRYQLTPLGRQAIGVSAADALEPAEVAESA